MKPTQTPSERERRLNRLKHDYNLSLVFTAATVTAAVISFGFLMHSGRALDLDSKVEPITQQFLRQNPDQDPASLRAEVQHNVDTAKMSIDIGLLGWTAINALMLEMRRRRYNKALENNPS